MGVLRTPGVGWHGFVFIITGIESNTHFNQWTPLGQFYPPFTKGLNYLAWGKVLFTLFYRTFFDNNYLEQTTDYPSDLPIS
jgi:hypothetical protein